ncbi:UNVERIFIED_CONTAM: hypothetical protein NCL1_40099 [Trichonephila clavipes]
MHNKITIPKKSNKTKENVPNVRVLNREHKSQTLSLTTEEQSKMANERLEWLMNFGLNMKS